MKEKQNKVQYALQVNVFDTKEPLQKIEKALCLDCDILALKFNIADSSMITEAVTLLKQFLPKITKPLMIIGAGDDNIDMELLPALINSLDRKSLIASANEYTYKQIVPPVIFGGHRLVIKTPIDINLAKEMNILTADIGLPLDKIIIDTDIGGLGYGLEYGYSTMEKIKQENDEYLNMPLISFAGEETLKTKEAKSADFPKSYGDLKTRAVMFEIAAVSAVKAAGASIIVVNSPITLNTMKGLV